MSDLKVVQQTKGHGFRLTGAKHIYNILEGDNVPMQMRLQKVL